MDVFLEEVKILPDTLIEQNDTLKLDIREYYELHEINPFDNYPYVFVGYSNLIPEIKDTSIAAIIYNYIADIYGEKFAIYGLKEGETSIILHFSWNDNNDSKISSEDKKFNLTVINSE